jgi:hypothetical protein
MILKDHMYGGKWSSRARTYAWLVRGQTTPVPSIVPCWGRSVGAPDGMNQSGLDTTSSWASCLCAEVMITDLDANEAAHALEHNFDENTFPED